MIGALAFLGLALARPPAVLGPDGPAWVGPLPPGEGGSPVVVVNPETGGLWVEEADAPGLWRTWDGAGWTFNGRPASADWPPPDRVSCEWQGGQVAAVTGLGGRRVRLLYGEAGRLAGILWPDGSRVLVRYDEEGRVVELAGPGTARFRLDWGDRLVVEDVLGRRWTVRDVVGGELGDRALEVTDATNRTARTWYRTVAGKERVVAWQDPRGLVTRVERGEGSLRVQDPAGRVWTVGLDALGRVEALRLPGGGEWTWARDAAGAVVRLSDPAGRVTTWKRDEAGQVVATMAAGQSWSWQRDGKGRVNGVVDPRGGRTVLQRDASGEIVSIVDVAGNTVQLSRFAGGQVASVVGRTGGRWALALDLLRRPDRVVDPTDRVVELRRDGRGRLAAVVDRRFGETRLSWTVEGRLGKVTDPAGRTTGFVRDAVGRLVAVRRPDGTQVRLVRDLAGDVVGVRSPGGDVTIDRDPSGLASSAADVSWERDAQGRVVRLRAPGSTLDLRLDPSGLVSAVTAGSWRVTVTRDAAGRPVEWTSTDGRVAVRRDPLGQVVEEREAMRVVRDAAGRVVKVTGLRGARGGGGEPTWSWSRDAAGRVLLAEGPEGIRVGADRDPAGRPVLVRFPGGALLRRSYDGAVVTDELTAADGRLLARESVARDQAGRVLWTAAEDGVRRTWHYDSLGQLIAIELPDGTAWSWAAGGAEGPHGELLVVDGEGRMSEAQVPEGPPAWGVAETLLTVLRDQAGRLDRLGGELGTAAVVHDELGRLAGIDLVGGGRWVLGYDPLGRLRRVHPPEGPSWGLTWGPGSLSAGGRGAGGSDPSGLLASGPGLVRSWVGGPDGPGAWAEPGSWAAIVAMATGDPRWAISEVGEPVEIRTTPMGFPDDGAAGLAGAGGALQLFAGGPLVVGPDAFDPVSGQRTDGTRGWPWSNQAPRGPPGHATWDPDAWAPESPWSRPLDVMLALGELAPLDEGTWTERAPDLVALPWLPASLDRVSLPPGPSPWSLPFSEDPVTMAFVEAALPGGRAPEPGVVLAALLATDDPSHELVPGLSVPGLEVFTAR